MSTDPAENIDLTIVWVVVNYYSDTALLDFIETQINLQHQIVTKILLVNNGSHDARLLAERVSAISNVIFIDPQKNTGYLGAAAIAYQHWLETSKAIPDFFILSNFDLKLEGADFLTRLVDASLSSGAALCGPTIVDANSSVAMNPMYGNRITSSHINRLLFFTSTPVLYFLYQGMHKLKRMSASKSVRTNLTENVYALHGSFLMFSKSFFTSGCTLQYPSFLYGEEIYLAEQLRLKGLKSNFCSAAKCIHEEHATTGKFKNTKHMKFLHESLLFLRNFYFR